MALLALASVQVAITFWIAETQNITLRFPATSFFIPPFFLPLLLPLSFPPTNSLIFLYLFPTLSSHQVATRFSAWIHPPPPGPTTILFEETVFRFAKKTATTKCMLQVQSSVHLLSPVAAVYKSVRWSQQSFISKGIKPQFRFTDFNRQPQESWKAYWRCLHNIKFFTILLYWGKMSLCFCVSDK